MKIELQIYDLQIDDWQIDNLQIDDLQNDDSEIDDSEIEIESSLNVRELSMDKSNPQSPIFD